MLECRAQLLRIRRASYGGPTCGNVGRGPAPLGTAANSSPAQASSSGSGCAPSTANAMRSALYWPLPQHKIFLYRTSPVFWTCTGAVGTRQA